MKWIVSNNIRDEYYNDFNRAVFAFKVMIIHQMRTQKDIYDQYGLPMEVGCHFAYKYDEGLVDDNDLIGFSRLMMLCSALKKDYLDINKCNDFASSRVKGNVNLHSEIEEFEESVDLDIKRHKDEIILDVKVNKDETYSIFTNAFLFKDNTKDYYFKSHQFITTSNNPDDLGKPMNIDVTLKYLSDS